MRTASKFLFLLLLTVTAACASTRSDPGIEPRETQVEVNNQAWMDMTVYVLDGGRRVRVGTATSARVTTLRIPNSVVGLGRLLRFQVDPVGSSNVVSSYEINVRPGQTVRLTIPSHAGR